MFNSKDIKGFDKLTKDQQFFVKNFLKLSSDLHDESEKVLLVILKSQKANAKDLLTLIAEIMLKYNIKDEKLKLTSKEKKQLRQALYEVINKNFREEFSLEDKALTKILKEAGESQYNINNYLLAFGLDFTLNKISNKDLDKILKKTIKGKNYSDRIWDNKEEVAKKLRVKIKKFLNGQINCNNIQEEIEKSFNTNKNNSERLIRNEIARVQNQVNEQFFEDNDCEYLLYSATLDVRTCSECASDDGKVFRISETRPSLPRHVNDRCTYIMLPNKNFRPSKRLDNMNKKEVDYKDYKEWYKDKEKELGKESLKTEEYKIKNRSNDKKQHRKYLEELGNLVPKKLEDFQNMKYTSKEAWDRLSYNYKLKTVYNLDRLKNTENFASKDAIKHILEGEVNKRGKAVGFHMENMPTKKGEIIESTRSSIDSNGIYSANVKINGTPKLAKSTFFPNNMTPQQIITAINEAYDSKEPYYNAMLKGKTSFGFEIGMYLDKNNKISTAFPIQKKR